MLSSPTPTLVLHCDSFLGEGTSGKVWRVADGNTSCIDGLQYAIKQVPLPDGVLTPALQAEVALQASLPPSEHIVRYTYAWVSEGTLHVLMERVDGGELWDALGESPCTKERMAWACSLLAAVASLHDNGVAHRDISPWNCFLASAATTSGSANCGAAPSESTGCRRLKLGDFGLACRATPCPLRGMTSDGIPPLDASAMGSLYSAPELGAEEGYDPLQVDIFSAGMTLFAILHDGVKTSNVGESNADDLTDCVERLKHQGTLPGSWDLETPTARLIRRMVSRNASVRPSAAECVELLRLAIEHTSEPSKGMVESVPESKIGREVQARGTVSHRSACVIYLLRTLRPLLRCSTRRGRRQTADAAAPLVAAAPSVETTLAARPEHCDLNGVASEYDAKDNRSLDDHSQNCPLPVVALRPDTAAERTMQVEAFDESMMGFDA